MDYSRILQFKGTWRSYQARVLEHAGEYVADGKIHIVAAPGSGKTTLGIELIKRMGQTALVLAPSITIRQQWAARIVEGFLQDGLSPDDYISQNLKEPRAITIVTYQSLHSAMTRFKGTLKDTSSMTLDSDDAGATGTEEVDYSQFDLIKNMKEGHLGLLCLDECHHLRSEWWKALEDFRLAMGDLKIVALTATPPYDSTPALWQRYMDMCGEIDEEIAIPELVKEGSLCPHQDFVYFNYPTEEESQEIDKFEQRSAQMVTRLMDDPGFAAAISTHQALKNPEKLDGLLENTSYFMSLLIYLKEKNIPFPASWLRIVGVKTLPSMEEKWMEQLLQGFLYDDEQSYDTTKEYHEYLMNEVKAAGLIEKKKVLMVTNPSLEKLLTNSKGKCKSIASIVDAEYRAFGSNLRLLILTDYIRKEYEKNLGDAEADVNALGVLPFFEQLRRESVDKNLRLGVLCGSIIIIPAEAKEALLAQVGEASKVSFAPVGKLVETDYVKVNAVGDTHFLTGAVTAVFAQGGMQVLIGTKSLLGEGWDCPCVNSLILASFVGSYMLSNQMRGRAIRVDREHPQKVSNIWHLVCIPGMSNSIEKMAAQSEDFALLKRRMDHFAGLNYMEDVIETGLARLTYIEPPFTKENIESINQKMLALSAMRVPLRNRWMGALSLYSKKHNVEDVSVTKENLPTVEFKNSLFKTVVSGAMTGACLAGAAMLTLPIAHYGLCGAGIVLGAVTVKHLIKVVRLATARKRLQSFGNGLCKALKRANLLEDSSCKAVAQKTGSHGQSLYLSGGTNRDRKIFAKCVKEAFSPVDNQRYLLVKKNGIKKVNSFYCVPDCLGKRKEDAALFLECIRPCIGKNYDLVYTRNEAGHKLLTQGRSFCLIHGDGSFGLR